LSGLAIAKVAFGRSVREGVSPGVLPDEDPELVDG
jgi:hypothetical protein